MYKEKKKLFGYLGLSVLVLVMLGGVFLSFHFPGNKKENKTKKVAQFVPSTETFDNPNRSVCIPDDYRACGKKGFKKCLPVDGSNFKGRWGDCIVLTKEERARGLCIPGEVRPCGKSSEGECKLGLQGCYEMKGVYLKGKYSECVGQTNPTPEVCDGLDNDCDGITDEGLNCPKKSK